MSTITEGDVQERMYLHLVEKGHSYIIPNVRSMFYSEADLVSVTCSNYLNEYEIKVNRSDFKREIEAVNGNGSWAKNSKHRHIERSIGDMDNSDLSVVPNKYWLVVPEGMVEESELPDHWGLYEILDDYDYPQEPVEKKKRASFIHKDKIDRKIMRGLGTNLTKRYWDTII